MLMMAENIKTPGDFSLTRGKEISTRDSTISRRQTALEEARSHSHLLPPSSFEAPKPSNDLPWKSLAKATNEILQLKLENQKLKEQKQTVPLPACLPLSEPLRAQISVQHANDRPGIRETSHHLDELITRQASEITELRTTLHEEKHNHQRELQKMEDKHLQTLNSMQLKERAATADYEKQLSTMKAEYESLLSSEKLRFCTIEKELKRRQVEVNQLGENLHTLTIETDDTVCQLKNQLQVQSCQIDEDSRHISQLKAYLKETQEYTKSTDAWKQEKQELNKKIQDLETDCGHLQSTMALVNVRLTAVNEILAIQESELSTCKLSDNKKKESNLLNRWREKVFSLLVQQKSADICASKDQQNWQEKISELKKELESSSNKNKVLSHCVEDKNAQLQIELNNNKALEQELTKVQQVAITLDDKLQKSEENAKQFVVFVEKMNSYFDEQQSRVNQSLSRLKSCDQRVSFASGRIQMLHGLLARRHAMNNLEPSPTASQSDEVCCVGKSHSGDDYHHIVTELETVTKERNELAHQLEEDARLVEGKLSHAKSQYEVRIKTLQNAASHAENQFKEKSAEHHRLLETYEHLCSELEEAKETIDRLKTDLGKQQIQADQAIKEREVEAESTFTEQLAELERKLNDARREQTKAVVSLRQLERQVSRDKERSMEHQQSIETYYKNLLCRQEQRMKSLEAEKNLMMTTIRQEGLLNKLRSQRPLPVVDDSGDGPMTDRQVQLTVNHVDEGEQEPLQNVIDDLEQLTAQVMDG